ncbi:TapB family protein [Hymenobacter elongatus]|uniref:DUF3108 domain-containing protein n=1 Tax=Hymenobacter elongatus TaxID=877208 RepID=A0A4Z0PFK7_9BACT|nr:hypothetical protein [Hymenobacter elongatus]TGE13905.1 hypothetical protein E5J99_18490 [Hymenobacter elongatus]
MLALPSLRFMYPLALALLSASAAGAQVAQKAPDSLAGPTTATTSAAPDCAHPFGLKDNMERVYRITTADGKAAGELRMRVVSLGTKMNKKKTVETHTALLKSGLYDSKNRLQSMQDLTFACRSDTSYTDGMAEFKPESLRSFRDRKLLYAPVALAWPHQPKVGAQLPDGGSQVQVSSSVVDIAKVSSFARKRKVVSGPESVTTPAGTFSCYKVESEHEDATTARKDMVIRSANRVVDYYSPAVGIVKTEVYGKNGKLAQIRTLVSSSGGVGR